MLKKKLLAAAVLAFSTTAVQANEVSGYLTGSFGQANAERPKSVNQKLNDSYKAFGGSTSSDRTDTAYKIAVGIKVNPYVALELQYVDLGESTYKGSDSFTTIRGPVNKNAKFLLVALNENEKFNLKTRGFGGNLVGTYPVEDFSLFAKAGYHYLETKGYDKHSFTETIYGVVVDSNGFKDSGKIRKWTPSFGAGASYNITPEFTVVAEYERYKGVADDKIQGVNFKHDIDLASVGLRYNF